MIQIFKNLLRYKTSTILNLVGLSTAFAVFILVMMQSKYDLTYDRWAKDHEQIHLLAYYDAGWGEEDYYISRNYETLYNGIPELNGVGVSHGDWRYGHNQEFFIGNLQDNLFEGIPTDCNKRFVEIFSLEFIDGGLDEFEDPSSIVVSEEIAKKISKGSVVGMQITNDDTKKSYTIIGVFKSIPSNTSIKANMFTYIGNKGFANTSNWQYSLFAKIDPDVSLAKLSDKILEINNKQAESDGDEEAPLLPKIYKFEEVREAFMGFSNTELYILLLIGVATLSIALINFINFTISTIPLKIKSINLRRVVGASKKELIISLILTDLMMMVVSFGVAVFLVELVKSSSVNNFFADTSFASNHLQYIIAGAISIGFGLLAGIYPAFYSTSFSPALLLKGISAVRTKGKLWRRGLIGVQFFVALCFISIAIFISLQHNHMITKDGGYIREGVLTFVNSKYSVKSIESLKNEILRNPQITDITFSSTTLGIEGGSRDRKSVV